MYPRNLKKKNADRVSHRLNRISAAENNVTPKFVSANILPANSDKKIIFFFEENAFEVVNSGILC